MKRQQFITICMAGLILWIAAQQARAVQTQGLRDDGFEQFSQGELESASLTSDGFLGATYARTSLGETGTEIVWDALREKSGSILCATGHGGKLIRLIDEKTSKTLAKVPEAELTALLRLGDGSTLVAAAPGGRIYRLGIDDQLTTWAQVKASYIWRMALEPSGAVWVATGAEGKLFRLTPSASGVEVKEAFKFKSTNLLDMWIDFEGALGEKGAIYVAGQDPGWLYRYLPGSNKAEVVFNSGAEEIRALVPTPEGLVLALNTERAPTAQVVNMTLRMAGAATGGAPAMRPAGGPPPQAGGQGAEAEQAKAVAEAFAGSKQPPFGPPRSQLVLLDRQGFARVFWTSPERPIHDLALSPENKILAAAGNQGRLFEVATSGEFSVAADLREDYLVRIAPEQTGYLLATARNGAAFEMKRTRSEKAVFVSRPLDGLTPVKWGHFYLHGTVGDRQGVKVAFRSGNDGDPHSDLWSPWSAEKSIAPEQALPIDAPSARYLQYRLTLESRPSGAAATRIDSAEAYYTEPNAPPIVQKIEVAEAPAQPQPGQAPAKNGVRTAQPQPAPAAPGGAPGAPAGGPDTRGVIEGSGRDPRSNSMMLTVKWLAADPNNDTLRYKLYYRASDEKEWKLIDDKLEAPQVPLKVDGMADGRYRFRVVATDELGNPPGQGLASEKISDEVIVDNTPPTFDKLTATVAGDRATIDASLTDELSLLSTLQMDIDNGDALPLTPADGVMDQPTERFSVQTGQLKPGEHVATLNATDRSGNSAVKKVVFTVEK